MRKRLMSTVLVMLLAVSAFAVSMTAFADAPELPETANGYAFNNRTDRVYENFDRSEINDTTTINGSVTDTGESYMRSVFAANSNTPAGAVYKHGIKSDVGFAVASRVVIIMRSKDGAVLADLEYGARGPDDDAKVAKLGFTDLVDPHSQPLPELTTEWQKYIIDLDESFYGMDYPASGDTAIVVSSMQGLHIMSKAEAAGKSIDIQKIYLTSDPSDALSGSRKMLNEFKGGTSVDATKNSAISYWAGANDATIMKRSLSFATGGEAVINAGDVTGYSWAVLDTAGEFEGEFSVATSTDGGTAFGSAAVYNGGVYLEDGVNALKITYTGSGAAVLSRIYLTNFIVRATDENYPVIDSSGIYIFDDFSIEQETILPYEASSGNQPTNENDGSIIAGRYGTGVEGYIYVKNGQLVITSQGNLRSIDFDVKGPKQPSNSAYELLVFKMRGVNATLSEFRFNLNQTSGFKWFANNGNTAYSGYGLPAAQSFTPAGYPYVKDGWTYFIVNLAETFETIPGTSVSNMTIYYGGEGSIVIDEIFFANKFVNAVNNDSKVVFDDFERTELFVEGGYWWGEVNCVNVSIDDGALKMTMEAGGAATFKAGGYPNNGDKQFKYIYMRMMVTGGIDFASLRFDDPTGGKDTAYWNQGKVVGLNGKPIVRPRNGEWADIYIDIDAMGFSRRVEGFIIKIGDWANTAAGTILIDEIAFVSEKTPALDANKTVVYDDFNRTVGSDGYWWGWDTSAGATVEDNALKLTPVDGLARLRAAKPNNNADFGYEILHLRMKGSAGTELSTFRFAAAAENAAFFWWNDLKFMPGRDVPGFGTGYNDYYIDLVASGADPYLFIGLDLCFGGTGSLFIDTIEYLGYAQYSTAVSSEYKATGLNAADYQYAGYVDASNSQFKRYMEIQATGTDEASLAGVRFEFVLGGNGGVVKWFIDNEEGSFVSNRGFKYDAAGLLLNDGTKYYTVDLYKTFGDSAYKFFDGFHIHTTGAATGGDLSFKFRFFDYAVESYTTSLAALPGTDRATAFTVTLTNNAAARTGDEITPAFTHTNQNIINGENMTVVYEVTFKSGADAEAEAVELTNGKFTAQKGIYTVKVTVTDFTGTTVESTKTITVTDAATGGDVQDPTGCAGCGSALTNMTAGRMAAFIAIATLFTFLCLTLMKRKQSKVK